MTEEDSLHYRNGHRRAWARMLDKCLKELGYLKDSGPVDAKVIIARVAAEREDVLAALRDACDEFGDNDWDDNLNLADVVNKHLLPHLHVRDELWRGDALDERL